MPTLKDWIEELAKGEAIEAVVLGEMGGWSDYGGEEVPNYVDCPKGVVLSWEDAIQWLSYEFSSSFGAPGCQAIYAWTATQVISVSQYDGSTTPFSIPRNPVDGMPGMPGG